MSPSSKRLAGIAFLGAATFMSIFNLKCIADLVLYFLTSALFIIGVFFLVRAKEGLLK